jgi:hypothetical protein
MKKLRGITIDNGGSEIRVLPDATTCNIWKWNNDIVQLDEKTFRVRDVERPECVIRVISAVPDKSLEGLYAHGVTGKMYGGQNLKISSQETKTGSDNFYKQLLYAVAMDSYTARLEDIASRSTSSGLDKLLWNTSNSYDYAIVSCIPIKEFNGITDCAEILKKRICGDYEVEFPLVDGTPRIRFSIAKENVGVVPEGGVAIMGLRKSINKEDISLVVDMGHVSTDIALFQGPSLLGKVLSSPYAGSTLIGNIRARLNDMGFYVSEDQVIRVLETGMARRGAAEVDVKDVIREEEQIFVRNYLQQEIIQVLNMNAINATQVQNFIPIGEPMNPHGGESSAIQDAIVRDCGLEYACIQELAKDLRYVNVTMAAKFTRKLVQGIQAKHGM